MNWMLYEQFNDFDSLYIGFEIYNSIQKEAKLKSLTIKTYICSNNTLRKSKNFCVKMRP